MISLKKTGYRTLFDTPPKAGTIVSVEGIDRSQRAYLTYRIYKSFRRPLLVVLNNEKDAQIFMEDLRYFADKIELPLIYFPGYHLQPAKILTLSNEISAQRIHALYRLTEATTPTVVVTT